MKYGKLIGYTVEETGLEIQYENGNCYVQQIADGILRFTDLPDKNSYAVILEPVKTTRWNISETKEELTVVMSMNHKEISVKIMNDFLVDIYEDGVLVCSDYKGARIDNSTLTKEQQKLLSLEGHMAESKEKKDERVEIVKVLKPGDAFYGLGDKPGCLNKRGYAYENWNTDDPSPHVDSFKSLYKSIPFFVVLSEENCYGILADNTYRTEFDFGKESDNYFFIKHEKGELDYYYISGCSIAQVVSRYVDLTGHAKLPQKWLFGYHQSRWSYFSEEEVEKLADNFRQENIPCDCIHLDIDYMDEYRVFTFDKKRFPNPKKMTERLSDKGFKLITIVDPGVKKDEDYFIYQKGVELDAFAHGENGEIYENTVWPGTSVFPDFTREDVRVWWGENVKLLTDAGVRGIWNDMNEPASFSGPLPDNVIFAAGQHDKIHNVYGHLMAKATYEGLKKYDSKRRPFVLTRACYAGSQRYCGGWTGDNHSIWSHIPLAIEQMCSLGLSGMMMSGSDIGGFGSDATPELMVRFFQAAVFSPFFRSHSAMGTKRQEPWTFNKETTDCIREVIKLRYRFIPYIYDLAHECERTGAPILRPLVYEFPDDLNVRNLADSYMLGSYVLVAPVMEPGKTARGVYLPKGQWYDFYTGVMYEGEQHILTKAPLNHLPLYIKAGAILPLIDDEIAYTEQIEEKNVKIYAYKGKGIHVHYIDDGESTAYLDGEYAAIRFEQGESGQFNREIIHNGYEIPEQKVIYIG